MPSTISQPSFVLRMLDMLQLEPGQRVFELGAGSAWNAASFVVKIYPVDVPPGAKENEWIVKRQSLKS